MTEELSIAAAARELGVSESAIRRRVLEGSTKGSEGLRRVPYRSGHKWLISRRLLEKWRQGDEPSPLRSHPEGSRGSEGFTVEVPPSRIEAPEGEDAARSLPPAAVVLVDRLTLLAQAEARALREERDRLLRELAVARARIAELERLPLVPQAAGIVALLWR